MTGQKKAGSRARSRRIARTRRPLTIVLLASTLLTACYRVVPVERPEAGDRITRVILQSGDTIAAGPHTTLEMRDTTVEVRHRDTGVVQRRIPAGEVAEMRVNRLDSTRTNLAVGAVVIGGLILLFASSFEVGSPLSGE